MDTVVCCMPWTPCSTRGEGACTTGARAPHTLVAVVGSSGVGVRVPHTFGGSQCGLCGYGCVLHTMEARTLCCSRDRVRVYGALKEWGPCDTFASCARPLAISPPQEAWARCRASTACEAKPTLGASAGAGAHCRCMGEVHGGSSGCNISVIIIRRVGG